MFERFLQNQCYTGTIGLVFENGIFDVICYKKFDKNIHITTTHDNYLFIDGKISVGDIIEKTKKEIKIKRIKKCNVIAVKKYNRLYFLKYT